jgi:EmrB/QacA subfamily drug resistance transporter
MGVGGAMIMPSTLSVIVDVFPRDERVKAIGIWTGVASLGIPLGPIIGGWLVEQFWWGSVFLLNLPIVLVALFATWVLVPESRNPAPPRPDIPGLILSVGALTALVYGIIEAPTNGWTSTRVIVAFAGAVVIGTAFIAHETRTQAPMLDLGLFANARLRWGTIATLLASLALTGLAFNLTQYLQIVQGYTPLQAGLRFAPLAIGFGIAGPASQRLLTRLGSGRAVAAGLGVLGAVFALLSRIDATTSYWLLGPALLLIGVGVGAAFVPATDAVMAAVPEANAGLGSAINDTSRQVGAALGIAIMGSIANTTYTNQINTTATRLRPTLAAVAKQSVTAAERVAQTLPRTAGIALERAAHAAFTEGFTTAILIISGVLTVASLLIARHLPAQDTITTDQRATELVDTT